MPSLWTLESSSSFGTVRDFDDSFRVLYSGCTTAPIPPWNRMMAAYPCRTLVAYDLVDSKPIDDSRKLNLTEGASSRRWRRMD